MTWTDVASALLLIASVPFFAAGTVGLLRFPDLYCRLHAVTKADNVGLGLTVIALMIRAATPWEVLKLALIWSLVLIASSAVCFLMAHGAHRRGIEPWLRKG